MDAELMNIKMESLTRCIQRLEEKTPESREILTSNLDLQDIIAVNLERAIQRSVDLGLLVLADYNQSRIDTMADVFTALEKNGIINSEIKDTLTEAVDIRYFSIHDCESIDWDIVWGILKDGLKDFLGYRKAILDQTDVIF